MKKLVLLTAMVLLAVGCSKEPKNIAVESVSISPATLPLVEGESGTLSATVSPSNATDKTVTWSSSNTQVATVADGKVTAVKAGSATITAKAGGKSGSCTVTVSAAIVPVSNITLDITEKELIVGETQQLTAKVEPADATDPTVTWTTSAATVATVENGLVTAVAEGQATITASAGGKNATCAITVLSTAPKMVDLGLSVMWADRNLGATKPTAYGAYYAWGETEPKETYDWNTYKWYNANEGLTKYSSTDNKILLEQEDDAAHAALKDKWRMPLVSEIEEMVEKCEWAWNAETKCIEVTGPNGNKISLPATGIKDSNNPPQMEGQSAACWSLNVCKVSTDAYLLNANCNTAPDKYNMVISYYRSCGLNIRPVYGDLPAPKAVVLNMNKATRYPNGVVNLRAAVYPKSAINKAVSWSSSNEAVATVNESGYVTVVGEGKATITVTTQEGGFSDQCVVTVVPTPEGAFTSLSSFNSSSAENPIFILENDWNPGVYSCVVTRANGIIDFNGHTSTYLYMNNNDPEQSVTVRNGIISHRLDGDAGWGHTFKGKVILEDMELYQDNYTTEFYTDGHIYEIRGGYFSFVTTYRKGDALGNVHIYDGTFEAMWDVNPDASSNQGEFYLYGGKFAFDPRDYKNPGHNPYANTKINIAEGYSVKENTGADKEDYPFIVTKN